MRLAIVILLSTLLGGCDRPLAEFSAETVIDQHGNVNRTTRYHAISDNKADEVKERYELLPGGSWNQYQHIVDMEDGKQVEFTYLNYELTRQYADGEVIQSDYIQPGPQSDKSAHNEFSVEVRHYGFVDTFRYQESYRDVVTTKGLSSAARQVYQVLIEELAAELGRIEHVELTVAELEDQMRGGFDPIFEQALAVFIDACMNPGVSLDACLQATEKDPGILRVTNLLDDETLIVDELINIIQPPTAYRDVEWRTQISTLLEDFEPERFSALAEEKEEEIFGVNGLRIFEPYIPFEISLDLPGSIVETNAHEHEAGTLVWRFTGEHFVLNEFVINARSRVIHIDRIVIVLVVSLVLLILLRRKKSKQANQLTK